jgi:hypothetical protein
VKIVINTATQMKKEVIMGFEIYQKRNGLRTSYNVPVLHISAKSGNFNINNVAYEKFRNAKGAQLLFDSLDRMVAIRPSYNGKEDRTVLAVNRSGGEKTKSSSRSMSGSGFLKLHKLNTLRGYTFPMQWDRNRHMFLINIDSPLELGVGK